MTCHDVSDSEIRRRLNNPPAQMVELDDALAAVRDRLDRLPSSVRAAIKNKRAAQDAEDLRRFIVATAHLSDAEMSGPFPTDHPLTVGMGSRRRWAMLVRWNSESRRRQLRTAHQVVAENRMAVRDVNLS